MIDTQALRRDLPVCVAVALMISILAWSVGFGLFVRRAEAASLTSVRDTLSDSDLGVGSNHTIQYTNATATTAGQTIRITFDPETDRFGNIAGVLFADVSFSGATLVASCGGGTDEVTLSTSTAANDESVIFTVCAGDTVSTGTKTITIGNTRITNPTSTASYIIRIAGTQANSADTRVAIIDDVVVTASVATTFTFTITGVATGTTINGVTTTYASTATALNFGTLPVGSAVTMGQQLNVTTNAANGFVVTVVEDQNLLSTTGADIDLFANGNATSTPSPWTAPANTLGSEQTYGHMGLTSNDSDLNAGEFAGSRFAGNFQATSSRQVFSHTGSADGSTQDIGLASVAYRIQIGSLQEAGNDYTNTLTYVATPTF